MKKLFAALLFLATSAFAVGTYTTRTGIYKPADGDLSWGPHGIRDSFDIIDSSFSVLTATQTFTGTITIDNSLSVGGYGGNSFLSICNRSFANCGTLSNPFTSKATLEFLATDGLGLGINHGNAQVAGWPYVLVTSNGWGVVSSSADSTTTYSGFKATSPIDQSVLWTLPKKDGSANNAIVTDGSAHLAFSSTGTFTNVTAASALTASYLTSGRCVESDSNGKLTSASAACGTGSGGGGASTLEVLAGVNRTSPTVTVGFPSTHFVGSVTSSSMTVTLNPATVELLGTSQTVTANRIHVSTRAVTYQPVGSLGVTNASTLANQPGAFIYDASLSTGTGLTLFNNAAQTVASANAMLTMTSSNTAYGGYFMRIFRTDSNSNGEIRTDSPNPNFEFVEVDFSTPSQGKYEFGINNGISYWATRNSADNSFERTVEFPNWSWSGGGITVKSTGPVRLEDSVGSTIGFKAPTTLGSSWTHDLWSTSSNVGKLLIQTSNSSPRALAWDNTVGVAGSSITFSSSVYLTAGQFSAPTINTTGTGDGEIIETIFGSTYTVASSSIIPATGNYAVYTSSWGTLGSGGQVIQLRDTLQSGATFYTSSGTVNQMFVGNLTAYSPVTFRSTLKFPSTDLTRQVTIQNGAASSAQLLINATDGVSTDGNFTTQSSATVTGAGGLSNTYGLTSGSGTFTTSLTLPNGTNPTVDVVGKIALDTTDNALIVNDGVNANVIAHSTHSFTVTIATAGWNGQNLVIWRAPNDMAVTINKVLMESLQANTTVLFQLDETNFGSTASAGVDVFTVAYASATNTGNTLLGFTNPGIAATASLVFNTPAAGASSGNPQSMTFTVFYTKNRE